MRIDLSSLPTKSPRKLKDRLSAKRGEIAVCIPWPSSSYYRDIAFEWLSLAYAGEVLAESCSDIGWSFDDRAGRLPEIRFVLFPRDVEAVAEKLFRLAVLFAGQAELNPGEWDEGDERADDEYEEDDEYDDVRLEFFEVLEEFRAQLQERDLRFPELADEWMANHLLALTELADESDASDDEDREKEHEEYPEWKFGFWRSYRSRRAGYEFYASESALIIPVREDPSAALAQFERYRTSASRIERAQRITAPRMPAVLVGAQAAIKFPSKTISAAKDCARALWPDREPSGAESYRMSTDGELAIVSDGMAHYVALLERPPLLHEDGLARYGDAVRIARNLLRKDEPRR